MTSERELCPHCNELHERMFSDKVLAIYEQIRQQTNDTERGNLLMALVSEFVGDFNNTNEELSDDLHDLVDEFVQSRLHYQQNTIRLGRVLLRNMQCYGHQEARPQKTKRPRLN